MDNKSDCPVEVTLAVIGGTRKAVLVYHLMTDGAQRIAELAARPGRIGDRILSRRPRELESDGIVARGAYPEVPPRVEYSPTEYGDSLRACEIGEHGGRPVTEAMCQWGKKHMTAGAARKLGASQGAGGSEIPEFLRQNSLKRELEQRGCVRTAIH